MLIGSAGAQALLQADQFLWGESAIVCWGLKGDRFLRGERAIIVWD